MIESETDTGFIIVCCWSLLVLLVTNSEDKVRMFLHLKAAWGQIADYLSTAGGRLDLTEDAIQQLLTMEAVGKLYGIPLEPMSALSSIGSLKERSDANIISSNLHRKISSAFVHLGIKHESEVSPFPCIPGTMAIDIASHKYRVAVEVDGPSHFLYSPNFVLLKEYNGPSVFKHRILERLGWKVINIDYREANSHQCSPEWLSRLLELNGVDFNAA